LRLPLALLVTAGFLWFTAYPAAAETRIALIVGNSAYANPDLKLTNPVNDATAMQRALQNAGFQAIVRLNARRLDFYRAVDEFATQIARDPHSVGLFYYAGHGVQADGTNYLIPVDADVQSVADLEANAFDVGRVLRAMQEAQNEMNIVILDACRNNPLPRTRGIERGLARLDAPSGTFIAYAAAPGHTAQDGATGTNGVFTGELVKAMAEPGVPLEQMFKRVIAAVKADTHGGQQPWSEASIQGDFFFHAGSAGAAASHAVVDTRQIELAYWDSIKNSTDPADFQAYLGKYPHGEFAGLAANRVKLAPAVPSGTPATLKPTATPAAAPAMTRNPADKRCESIQELTQIGETLSDEDRAYLRDKCK
jgi:Caspase domain